MTRLIGRIAVLALTAAVAFTPAACAAGPELVRVIPADQKIETVSVNTSAGTLVGESVGGVDVFRGVPFAAAPVGDLRWKAPQPVEPWVGDRAAIAYEPACPQPVAADVTVPNQGGVAGPQSEDCLYLEVYAPATAAKAPVVVWLHGGGAFLGAGHLGSYVGTSNAEKGVITVPINYRLGSLGYFAHSALTAEGGATGSYAMMDAVAALEWVRDNIEAFGGDPENVTIAGQSAGGVMVINLLSMPSAQGLFDKAVIQSGAFLSDGVPRAEAEQKAVAALAKIGVGPNVGAADLRRVSAQTLAYNPDLRRGLGPIIDGGAIVMSAKDAFAAGEQADVPILIGANGGERGFHAAQKIAQMAGSQGASAWLYRFDYMPEFRKATWKKGAIHSAELMFTFDSLATSGWSAGQTDASDEAYANLVSSCWIAFYKMPTDANNISCADDLEWPAYTAENKAVASFADVIEVADASGFPDGPAD